MSHTRDASLNILLQQLHSAAPAKSLWFADEQHHEALLQLVPERTHLKLLSSRFDVAQQALQLGLDCEFSDWRMQIDTQYTQVLLRVCKEKPINQHLVRLAYNHLLPGGQLLLAGQKNEGFKTVLKYAEAVFGHRGNAKKHGNTYLARLERPNLPGKLDLSDYHQLHTIAQWRDRNLQSKPGVYGWDKIDSGSELLINTAEQLLQQQEIASGSVLDIGCGYGLLSLATSNWNCERRVATDNNAAAVLCCELNAKDYNIKIEVLPSDCADTIDEQFDLVLCNPPFHKGFDVDADLTRRFVLAASRRCRKGGKALFVVNSFIPLENKIAGAFRHFEVLSNSGQFKVVALSH